MSKIENKKLVIAITLLSFLVQCTTMLSPTLLVFQKSFPDVSMTTIQSLLTLPSLISIPFFFLGGALSRTISTKKMLIVGVSIIAVGGLLPIFLHDFGAILVCRAIMGMGLGLMNPFAQSLVSDNFEDEGITLMFGIQAAATSAGNMIGCYASGYLAAISYNASFLCYLMAPVALLAIIFWVPKESKHPVKRGTSALKDYFNIPVRLWLRYLYILILGITYFAYFNNTSMLMEVKGIGGTEAAGLTTALSSIIGIISGLLMPALNKKLKKCLLPMMTLAMMAGLAAELWANSMLLINIGSACIGFAYSVIMPYTVASLTREYPDLNHTVTSALFVAAGAIGASVSSYALAFLSKLFGMEGAVGQITIGVGMALVLTVFVIVYQCVFKEKA
jgi:MFS family permease